MKYERSNELCIFKFLLAKKKKKPKLLNKFDKTIKAELDAAEKLRKKVSFECFIQAVNSEYKLIKVSLEKWRITFCEINFLKLSV